VRRRQCVDFIRTHFSLSERRACEILGLSRSTHRYAPRREPVDEQLLLRLLQRFVADHPRHGYRRFWAQLQQQGVNISLKTTYRLWRQHHSRLGNGRST